MTAYYKQNPKFYVGIDCIIFGFDKGELNLLLLKRNFEPAKGKWSLMGGFIQENESADDAAKRVLSELTGLENVYMEQIGAFGEVDRDPGERVISLAYYALININEYDRELVQQHNAYWVNINELPDLIFDHSEMVAKARTRIKNTAWIGPLASTCCLSYLPCRNCKACMKPYMASQWTSGISANESPTWDSLKKQIK